jgi:type II secretory pathway pseudopilin PulG
MMGERAGEYADRNRHDSFVPSGRACANGFTILEIVIVLAITVTLLGLAVPVMTGLIRGEELKAPARTLEAMAITARCNALAEQRPYQIVLEQKGFRLERVGGEVLSEYQLPGGVNFELATWPEEKWGRPRRHVWYFAKSGLCEPIRVMFRKGDGYFLQRYSAVTGWDQDEELFIP